MKKLFFLITFFTTITYCHAQINFNFNKSFVECDNNWVVIKTKNTNEFGYAFIYFDKTAGFTLDYGGSFTVDSANKINNQPSTTSIKSRLQPNNNKVALLPIAILQQLNIEQTPKWLSVYIKDSATAGYLYAKGFAYNVWGKGAIALPLLQNAYEKEPSFNNLTAELAYTYNDLGSYQKALEVLKKDIANATKSGYHYKEYAYAHLKLGDLKAAAQTYELAAKNCEERSMIEEIAYNLTYEYFKVNNKEQFNFWAKETEKWGKGNDQFLNNINILKAKLAE